MDRREFLGLLGAGTLPFLLSGEGESGRTGPMGPRAKGRGSVSGRSAQEGDQDRDLAHPEAAEIQFSVLDRSDERWREILPRDAYRVLFEEETEPRGSSPLLEESRAGTYLCAACRLPLFDSSDKFDSGTGWPSFVRPLSEGHVETKRDFKLILPRTEYHCARCGGHQGHVFDDGPPPTGRRWCNNGLALAFVPAGEDLPALRG